MTQPLPAPARRKLYRLSDQGHSSAQIASALGCTKTTVQRYLKARERAATPVPAIRPTASMPFGPGPQGPANTPTPAWYADQPPPPPESVAFKSGYHDHTYRNWAQPIAYDGWTIERIRSAIAQHDIGIFIESSTLCVTLTRFGPVYTALAQAIAPVLGLPRHVTGGTRGLSKVLAAEIESQLAPRAGLQPSPYFPPTIWGSAAIDIRMMGFCVLQHVYGDEDPQYDVRPLYTRRWPTWACMYYPSRRTFIANADAGPVDIISGDGKFTLLADREEPHHDGAVRALALEVLAGVLADQALASYINRYGNPKLVITMPPNTPVRGPEGDAMFEAAALIRGPDGYGVVPHGTEVEWASLSASQSAMFKEANEKITARAAGILLGSDGTITSGTGGVYQSPYFWGVRRDIISRTLGAIVRGINSGHVAPYLSINYEAAIEEARGWVSPVLTIPLPDPDADARQKSIAERTKYRHELIKAERDAGLVVTQERVDQLSAQLGLETIAIAAVIGAEIFAYDLESGIVTRNEQRKRKGFGPLPDGDETVPEMRIRLGITVAGGAVVDAEPPPDLGGEEAGPDAPVTAPP
jgi:hypothetical protein